MVAKIIDSVASIECPKEVEDVEFLCALQDKEGAGVEDTVSNLLRSHMCLSDSYLAARIVDKTCLTLSVN